MIQKLGRFRSVRQTYSAWQHRFQRHDVDFHRRRLQLTADSLFEELPAASISAELRQDGISVGMTLPQSVVQEVVEFATKQPCRQPGIDYSFFSREVHNGVTHRGDSVDEGIVCDGDACSAIQRIARDPQLLSIVHAYLRYWPNQIQPRLRWNFCNERRTAPTSKEYAPSLYHYDVKGLNFMAAMFFLTPTTANCGAHVMIRKSHRRKPLEMLWHPGVQSDAAVERYFPQEDKYIVSGPAGYGFVEDISCLHRAAPACLQDRLILIVRYS